MTVSVNPPALLTVPATADRLSVSRATVYNLIADRALESVKVGRSRRVPSDAIDAYIAGLRKRR